MAKRKRRVVRRRRRKNPSRVRRVVRRRRRRNPRGVPGSGAMRKLAQDVARAQRAAAGKSYKPRKGKKKKGKGKGKRRKAVIAYRPTRRRRKWKTRRFTGKGWHDDAGGHKKASRHGWTRRSKGKRGRKFYVTSKGRKYHRPKGKSKGRRGVFKMWNPKGGIRTRNPNGMMDVAMPVLLGIAGFLGAAVLVTTLGKYVPDSMKKWAPAAIPVALGLAAMFLAPKYLPKYSKISYGLGFGLLMAGGISLMSQVLPENVKAMIGLSSAVVVTPPPGAGTAGYVYRPGAGVGSYTLAPSMSGYVSRPGAGIGSGYNLSAPLESRYRRTLGANTVVAPGQFAPGGVPTQISTGYETVGMKPYGLGLPMESRRYNNYSWIGVYDKGVYE